MNSDNIQEQHLSEDINSIDLKKIIYKSLSNWYWFISTIFLFISIAFIINRYKTPIYKVESSLLIRDKNNSSSMGMEDILEQMSISNGANKNVENEKGILSSYSLTRKTIENLNFGVSYYRIGRIKKPEIYKEAPFIVIRDTLKKNIENCKIRVKIINDNQYQLNIDSIYEINKILYFGESYESDDFNFTLTKSTVEEIDTLQKDFSFKFRDLNEVANEYREKIEISTQEKGSSILILSTKGVIVEKEVDYLNKLSSTYIETELLEKNRAFEKTIEFIDNQLNIITDSLSIAEKNLQSFKEKNRTVDLSIEGGILYTKLEELQKQLSTLLIQQNYYKYLLKYIKEKQISDIISPTVLGINDPSLSKMVLELNEQSSKLSRAKSGLTDNSKNPALEILEREVEDKKELIKENLNTIIHTNSLSIADVKKEVHTVDQEIRKLPLREKQLINIKRKFTLNDEIYNFLLKKRAESEIAKASNIAENKILDKAIIENSELISPRKAINYIIAILLGLFIPVIFIIINDFFDNKINEKKDIESRSQIPIIAEIGLNNYESDLVVHKYPRSSISESFRKLRTSLLFSLINKKDSTPVIAITSTISGEGKSFTSVNIASVIATTNKKTVIIGLDLRKPTLHKFFNTINSTGMSDYLSKQASYDEIIYDSGVKGLSLIPAGTIPPNPAELIELPQMRELIEKLKSDFGCIIIDTAPVALVTDALLISDFVDTYLYVSRQGYSKLSSIDFISDIKNKHNLNLNIILNGIKPKGYYALNNNYSYKYGGGYYGENYYQEEIKVPFFLKITEFFKRK